MTRPSAWRRLVGDLDAAPPVPSVSLMSWSAVTPKGKPRSGRRWTRG